MKIRRWALPLTLMLSLVIPTLGIADDGDSEKHSAQRLTWSRPCEQALVVTGTAHHPVTSRTHFAPAAPMEARWVSTS